MRSSTHMTIAAGTRLGRYEIRSQIGAGGMGEVYLARDTRLGRTVALKLLRAEVAADRQRMHRFEKEAKAASALNHPNIITIYEIDEIGDAHFMAMEFIEGETLRAAVANEPMKVAQALDVAEQVASALAAAHDAGIVHRDIKPDNIMLRRDGYVKVLDFGLVKLTERYAAHSEMTMLEAHGATAMADTDPGMVMGTVHYMSPEQAQGQPVDGRTDVWSLGIVLYKMLTKRVPFEGKTPNHVIVSIIEEELQPITLLAPGAPAELERIMTKALRKEKDERYPTIREMAQDLKRLRQRLEFETELERSLTPEEAKERMAARNSARQIEDTIIETLPPRSDEQPPNNLSVEHTSLIGRDEEVAAIKNLLRQEDVRLLTLTGIGGTGKTRLAQSVARQMLAEFADGTFFIELSPISDPALVVSEIAQPLGLREAGGTPLPELLKAYLRERAVLLAIDNFEQVTAAAPLVAELLAAAPKLKVLVTSRALLHLSMEHEFGVPPLALPSGTEQPSVSELLRYAAIALFVERARAAKQGFTLTEENASAVAEICARLDGLPLAIELAAARIKLLPPQAILTRLESRLKLLTGGARDLPARQQTMRGAISWSYDLLDEDERKLLQRLSVFAGEFQLEAAEVVCGEEVSRLGEKKDIFASSSSTSNPQSRPLSPIEDVLEGVTSLVDKSLLVQKDQSDGEPRFRMLGVVREYAAERLAESGEAEAVRQRHAHFFLTLAERAEPELVGAHQAGWLDRLEDEHDNLRAALRWTIEYEALTGLRLAAAVWRLWAVHGHLTEGRGWLEEALKNSGDAPATARGKALHGAGTLAWLTGDLQAACVHYEEALWVGKMTGDRRQVGLSSRGLGIVAQQQGELVAARMLFEESLSVFRELSEQRLIAITLNGLGELARQESDFAAARAYYEESLILLRQAGDKEAVSLNLVNLGAVVFEEDDLAAARTCYAEVLAVGQELGYKVAVSYALDGFGALAAHSGEWERAARLAGAAEALRAQIGYEIEATDRFFRDRYVTEAQAGLGAEVSNTAHEQGRALKTNEAIALALQEAV